MKLKNSHQISTQFNMSSMTDIVFLLLIFFMLTASFVTPAGLPIDLPTSNTSVTATPQVSVTITASLDYYINNQPIVFSQLKDMLQKELPAQDGIVLLQVDKSVPIEYMIKVVDIASSLHAQVSVATRPGL